MHISPAIAGMGTWPSPGIKSCHLPPQHLIFCVRVSPAFVLHSLVKSNWFFMRPLCPISSHVKHVSAVWQQVLGVRGPTLGSHPLSQCPNFPWAGCDPSAHAARLLSGVFGLCKEENAWSFCIYQHMLWCFSPSTCKAEITALNPSVSEECWEI